MAAFDESKILRDDRGRFAGSVGLSSAFTEQQEIELKDYKEGNYQQLNQYLRNPASVSAPLGEGLEEQVATLDAAVEKSILQNDTVVYRGIQHKSLAANAEKLIGREVDAPTFLSTSTSSRAARDFAGFGEGAVVMALKAPKGSRAVFMDSFASGGNSGESELLFGRNSKVKITGVDRSRKPPVVLGEFV